ncbi:MAG: hypothetical protein MJZ74_03835 [Muribaculaceae bacterium]|nr:hypothetical protein [Muribaculaceae bacterium]
MIKIEVKEAQKARAVSESEPLPTYVTKLSIYKCIEGVLDPLRGERKGFAPLFYPRTFSSRFAPCARTGLLSSAKALGIVPLGQVWSYLKLLEQIKTKPYFIICI